MATNMGNPSNHERIALQCSCGKRLSALSQHAGKRLKCPACGKAVIVPTIPSPQPTHTALRVEDESDGLSKTTLIALWSLVGATALGGVLFLVWHSHASHQAKIAAANDRISQAIDGKRITEAIALLREYLADPRTTDKADAQRLLAEAEIAVSDALTIDALIAMNNEKFDRVKITGEIDDEKVTHPVLLGVRKDTIQRNFDEAVQRREEIKIANLERQRQEEERRRVEQEAEQKREEKARRWAKTDSLFVLDVAGGQLAVTVDSPTVYLPAKGTKDYCGFVNHAFRDRHGQVQREKAGFYEVDGLPSEIRVSSETEELVELDICLTFKEAGNAYLRVEFAGDAFLIPLKIVRLEINEGDDAADVIRAFGLPDEEKEISVSWPDVETHDNITYSTSTPEVRAAVFATHWRYKKYPHLVFSIVGNRIHKISSYRKESFNEFFEWTKGR